MSRLTAINAGGDDSPTFTNRRRGPVMVMLLPGADRSEHHRFVRHFLEMVAAMIVGMMVVGGAVRVFCVLTGHEGVFDHAGATALIMATNMIIGMSVWMRYRHHSWAAIADMAAAMYVPFAILIVPFWLGLLSGRPAHWTHARTDASGDVASNAATPRRVRRRPPRRSRSGSARRLSAALPIGAMRCSITGIMRCAWRGEVHVAVLGVHLCDEVVLVAVDM